jgi:hypothetical protein
VRSLSEVDVKAKGLNVMDTMPPQVPDPGWEFNPGKVRFGGIAPREAEGQYKDIIFASLIKSSVKTPVEDLPAKKLTKDMLLSPRQKSGLKEEDYVNIFLREFGAEIGKPVVFKDVVNEPLVISEDFFKDRKTGKFKVTKADREIYLKMLADTIKDPVEIWLTIVEGKNKTRLCKRYIGVYKNDSGKIGGYAVFNLIGDVWKGTTTLQAKDLDYLNRQREGKLLYSKKKPANKGPR